MVGITLITKFVQPGTRAFGTYINYIDREIAARNHAYNDYCDFTDYMGNVEKSAIMYSDQLTLQEKELHVMTSPDTTTELFTVNSDRLTINEKESLKEAFSFAQDNGSLMWQTVISFDNRWLVQNGLLDSSTNNLNIKKMQEYTRASMTKMLEKENLNGALWSAAIHYNTDNLHIHIATVEVSPTRERGKFKQSSINTAKSVFTNKVLSQSLENQKINEIIRGNIIHGLRESPVHSQSREITSAFKHLYQSLPADQRLLKYNNNAMKNYRAEIDNISTMFINKYYQKEYEELSNLLAQQQKQYTEAYGNRKSQVNVFTENKMADLYARMGNSILSQCKEYRRIEQHQQEANKTQLIAKQVSKRNKASEKLKIHFHNISILNQLKKALKSDLQASKNQAAYSRLQDEIEMERN